MAVIRINSEECEDPGRRRGRGTKMRGGVRNWGSRMGEGKAQGGEGDNRETTGRQQGAKVWVNWDQGTGVGRDAS